MEIFSVYFKPFNLESVVQSCKWHEAACSTSGDPEPHWNISLCYTKPLEIQVREERSPKTYYNHTARQCRASKWAIIFSSFFFSFLNFWDYFLHGWPELRTILCIFFCISEQDCAAWAGNTSPQPRPLQAFLLGLWNNAASHPRTQTQFASYSPSIFILLFFPLFSSLFFFPNWMAINFTNRFHRGYVTPPPDSKSITVQRDRVAESLWSPALGFPWGTEKLQC